MIVLLSASVSRPYYRDILINDLGRKILNALKKRFNAVGSLYI